MLKHVIKAMETFTKVANIKIPAIVGHVSGVGVNYNICVHSNTCTEV